MSQPAWVRSLDGFVFTWPDLPFEIGVTRIRDSRTGTNGELSVKFLDGQGKYKTLTHQTCNLLTSKARLAKELNDRHALDWLPMLEAVCIITLRSLRQGEPIESLAPRETDHPADFMLNPLLYHQNPNVFYGPGDSMKSFFALYCGLLLATGVCGPSLNVAPTPWRVLFLDWEMSVQDVRGRVKMLQTGDPRLTGMPDYRRCYQPLADEVSEFKTLLSDGQYDLLIIDSLAMAAGGQELERADSAIRFNAALRSLNCTSLIIGHTPKPQEDQKERSLYGSVFFSNLIRNSWECRREGNTLGLYHRKHNLGPEQSPHGFTIEIDHTSCRITEASLADDPILSSGLPLQDRIASALKESPGQTVQEVALMIGEKPASMKAKLYLFKKHFMAIKNKWECIA